MSGFWTVGTKIILLFNCATWLHFNTTDAFEITEHANISTPEEMYIKQQYEEMYLILDDPAFDTPWENILGWAYDDITVLRGIPYAQPPIGDLRFEKPQPHPGWEGELDGKDAGNKCPQFLTAFDANYSTTNEDCLLLDIFLPPVTFIAGVEDIRPVLVYFHGGNFIGGSKDEFYGRTLAKWATMVVVSVNYRLGLLGFMASGDGFVPGNLGLYDQQMAVQWVKDNIRTYGGDPDSITLIGFEAGGVSVVAQMLSPLNNGSLFQRVIILSSPLTFQPPTATNSSQLKQMESEIFQKVLALSNCSGSSNAVDCLRELPAEHFVQLANDIYPEHYSPMLSLSFGSEFLPGDSDDIMGLTDNLYNYDVMIGFTEHDGVTSACHVGEEHNLTDVIEELLWRADPMGGMTDVSVRTLEHYYKIFSDLDNSTRRASEFTHLFDDWFYNVPGSQFSQALIEANLTSTYVFRLIGPVSDNPFRSNYLEGSGSTQDDMPIFLFGLPIVFEYAVQEQNTSKNLIKFISNFALTGDPNEGIYSFDETWSKYDADSMNVFVISEQLTTSYRSSARAVDLWTNLVVDLGGNDMCGAPTGQETPPVSSCSDKASALKEWKERMEKWKEDNREWKDEFDKFQSMETCPGI